MQEEEEEEEWAVLRELEQIVDPLQGSNCALFSRPRTVVMPSSPAPFASPLQHKRSLQQSTAHSLVQTPLSTLKKRAFYPPSDPLATDPSALDDLLGLMSDPSSSIAHTPFLSKYRRLNNEETRSPRHAHVDDAGASGSTDTFHQAALSPFLAQARQKDYTKAPSDAPFVMARTSNGNYLYFPQRTPSQISRMASNTTTKRHSGKLLQTSIYQLMEQLDQKEKNKALMPLARQLETFMDVDATNASKKELWVDKYRPKMYIDLTGEEVCSKTFFNRFRKSIAPCLRG